MIKDLLLLIGVVLWGITCRAQPFYFEKIGSSDGLSHNTVYAISQDHKGFIWIGTREGLNRYDSREVQNYYAQTGNGLEENQISALLPAQRGMWVGTNKGLYLYENAQDTFIHQTYQGNKLGHILDLYQGTPKDLFICSWKGLFLLQEGKPLVKFTNLSRVRSICTYKTGIYWVILGNGEIRLINSKGESIRRIKITQLEGVEGSKLRPSVTNKLHRDQEGKIWLATYSGLYQFSEEKEQFELITLGSEEFPLEARIIRTLTDDNDQNIWMGTEAGIFVWDKQTQAIQQYTQSFSNSPLGLSDKAIYSTFRSREGIIWIGTYFGGVNFAKPKRKQFSKMISDGGKQGLSGKAVSQIMETSEKELYIGTEDGGISIYHPRTNTFKYLTYDQNTFPHLRSNNVHSLLEDQKGNILIGTFLGGLHIYDPQSQTIKNYKFDKGDPRSLSNNMVYSLLEDRKGTIWVGTQKGLNYYEPSTHQFKLVKPKQLGHIFLYDMIEDDQGTVWIGSRNNGIFKYVAEEDSFYQFSTANRAGEIPSDQIIEVTQLSNGKLCFGTLGGGILFYEPIRDKFSHIGLAEGLLDANVYQIQEDSKGRLWVSTNKGLSMYDTLAQTFIHHDVSQGLPSNQFNFRSSYQDEQGFMYFGTVNGLCYFHPDSLEIIPQESALYFNNFKLFSREVPITPQGVLPQHIDYTKEIELEYHQNVLEFSFVNIDYFSASPTQFSYFLEGFEEEWNEAVYQRSATYTNLSPGSYTFHLKVVNGSNGNTLAERNIKLAVRSPWWLSPMALGIYGVLLVVAVVLFARFNRFLEKQKMALKLERLEKEQSNELTQHKLNFFTYITHEFKTPLTLIIFQIDRILENTDHWIEASTPDFLRIKRNASRLHRLIDQLMEFRKIESDHASLELRRGDIIPFVKDTFEAFHPLFSNKQITNSFESNCSHFHAYFDADKIEKILTNLLSNAIKSTEEFGEINLSLGIGEATDSSDFKWLTIDISDTGEGILASDSEKVFLPFYQKKSTGKSMGSGIGLTLVNSLIAFLDGKMELKSTPNQGTTITLQLPLYPLHPKDKELHRVIRGNKNLQIDPTLYEEEEETLSNSLPVPDNLTLMIVEDSRDLRHFLSRHFSSQYHVVVASNGKDALDKIEQAAPDLIVSDVMMPQMDGLELCKQLKTQVHTSHIPLILLSARSEIQHKLEGLNIGADVYLPKPFNLKEVELTIKNLVQARKNLRQHFLQFGQWPLEEIPSNNKEQEFLKRVLEIVEKNYQDSSLSVVTLSEELGVSRSLLYLKLKKIADLSATELIKTVRMKHAVRLLRSGCSVADTAYQTGFTDPNYFGRIFKKHYNIPPSQFSQEPESSSQKT